MNAAHIAGFTGAAIAKVFEMDKLDHFKGQDFTAAQLLSVMGEQFEGKGLKASNFVSAAVGTEQGHFATPNVPTLTLGGFKSLA